MEESIHGPRGSGILLRALVLAAMLVTATACHSEVAPDHPPGTTTPAGDLGPGIAGTITQPGQTPSTIMLRTRTPSGAAIPGVDVKLTLIERCDAALQNIPADASDHSVGLSATTDANGSATFVAVVGCYYFEIKGAPQGRTPVTAGRQTLFLTTPGQVADAPLILRDK